MGERQKQGLYSNIAEALNDEWLETNGLGGFASSTVSGCNTRRYHGILVADPNAATDRPPAGRRVLLNTLEEKLIYDDSEVPLSSNIYPGACHPEGYRSIVGFERTPWPTVTFQAAGMTITKQIAMLHGTNRTVVRYTLLEAPEAVWLAVNPLISGRDYHHLMTSNNDIRSRLDYSDEHMCIQPYDEASRLCLYFGGGHLSRGSDGLPGQWYYNFVYPIETRRGLDDTEDLYCPGELRWLLHDGDTADLVASCEPLREMDVDEALQAERQRCEKIAADGDDQVARQFRLAADDFLIDRDGGTSVIAGYPWFTDWGRDTMISLPGLTISTDRYEDCRSILRTYINTMKDGLIPNLFPDGATEPAYNTCDGTLWMFAAARDYYAATRDLEFFDGEVYEAMKTSIRGHIEGTRFNIGMDDDGLLHAGDAETQLTWMDAKVGDWVVTPRHGKPVEINALWYNALRTVDFLAGKFEDEPVLERLGALSSRVKEAFRETFYSEDLGYCHDVIGPEGPDSSLRPNQLVAGALKYSLLDKDQLKSILAVTADKLLTPYGLRTLSPEDPQYQGRYSGDQWERDGAYHQGTVWPWLIGPYVKTYLAAHGKNEESYEHAREVLRPLVDYLLEHGSIPEIFEGDVPHEPRGCFAQAWSVAQVLECWMRVQ